MAGKPMNIKIDQSFARNAKEMMNNQPMNTTKQRADEWRRKALSVATKCDNIKARCDELLSVAIEARDWLRGGCRMEDQGIADSLSIAIERLQASSLRPINKSIQFTPKP